jgi:choline dehydrogenase-like flavoprotein
LKRVGVVDVLVLGGGSAGCVLAARLSENPECRVILAYVAEHNRPGAMGVGPMPCNARAGVRMSAALTYLTAAPPS